MALCLEHPKRDQNPKFTPLSEMMNTPVCFIWESRLAPGPGTTAQKMLNVLYRTCKDINDITTKKLLYIAWVGSHLEYASVVWSPHTKRNINNLAQVQRRATRFILGRDYSEYKRLSKLNLLPLKYWREINDLVFFFKCLKNICKLNILDYVSFCSCTKPLRNVDHLTSAGLTSLRIRFLFGSVICGTIYLLV